MTFLQPLSTTKYFRSKTDKKFMLQSLQHNIKAPFMHKSQCREWCTLKQNLLPGN